MKKSFLLAVIALGLNSCDYILKKSDDKDKSVSVDQPIQLGADKDEHGCVASAGYMYSVVKQDCIRIFEQGLRLIPSVDVDVDTEDETDQALVNAYLLFDKSEDKAEIFVVNDSISGAFVLEANADKSVYSNKSWKLIKGNQYQLNYEGKLMYVSPLAHEKKQISSDVEE